MGFSFPFFLSSSKENQTVPLSSSFLPNPVADFTMLLPAKGDGWKLKVASLAVGVGPMPAQKLCRISASN